MIMSSRFYFFCLRGEIPRKNTRFESGSPNPALAWTKANRTPNKRYVLRRFLRRGVPLLPRRRRIRTRPPSNDNEYQYTRSYQPTDAPLSMSCFSGTVNDNVPFSSSAAKIIPSDKIPQILTGFKLVTNNTFLPTSSSGA